jgi:uncharacterized membrane protein
MENSFHKELGRAFAGALIFAILEPGTALQDIFGKTALLSVPAGIGAIVAQKQL